MYRKKEGPVTPLTPQERQIQSAYRMAEHYRDQEGEFAQSRLYHWMIVIVNLLAVIRRNQEKQDD